MLRSAILAAADSPRLRRFVDRYGMQLGAARFVGGETLDEVVVTLRGLNEQGLRTNTTLLGEHVGDPAEAEQVTATYEEVLRRIAAEKLRTNVSVKPTHLGAALDEELGYSNIERLVTEAGRLGNFVRIDMEDSSLVDPTLRIYRRLREAGHDNVGTVLQAYLYRTPEDLESLLPLQPNLRIVKGAYKEPASIAHPKKADVDAAYDRLVERCLEAAAFTAVATHDERRIEKALALGAGPGPDGAPDAVRRAVAAPARARPPGSPRAGRHPLRARLVPVPDAAARRAAREPPLLRPKRPRRLRSRHRFRTKRFAEPGVAFVHRPDRPSACAYRLLGSASTYSRPVLGASALYDAEARGSQGEPRANLLANCGVLLRDPASAARATIARCAPGTSSSCWSRSSRSSRAAAGRRPTRRRRAARVCSPRVGWSRGPPASDLVASAAEGGSYTVRFGKNFATVSFGTDRDGAERIVRAYQRFRGKNIGLLDVLSAKGNAVMLWAIHPEDADIKVIEGCLV